MRTALKRCKRSKEIITTNGEREYQTADKQLLTNKESLLLRLPVHLIFDILVRLPIYSILNCRCVCKFFSQFLRETDFTEAHLKKTPNNDCSLVIQELTTPSNIFLVPMIDLDKPSLSSNNNNNNHCDSNYSYWQTLTPPASIPRIKHGHGFVTANLICSCNGLLYIKYLYGKDGLDFYVCNPILGEVTLLPPSWLSYHQSNGFGYCPKSKQYKAIRFFHALNYVEILTLGTDNWRRIDVPLPDRDNYTWSDSYFRGNLHWIVKDYSICSFNLETEQYLYLSPPSHIKELRRMTFLNVGTLGGLFCISYVSDEVNFETCVMMDYGVSGSWVKKISIKTSHDFGLLNAIRFLSNGFLVLNQYYHTLACYNTLTETTTNAMVGGNYTAVSHVPSLVSLKDVVKVENVEKVQRKMLRVFLPSSGVELSGIGETSLSSMSIKMVTKMERLSQDGVNQNCQQVDVIPGASPAVAAQDSTAVVQVGREAAHGSGGVRAQVSGRMGKKKMGRPRKYGPDDSVVYPRHMAMPIPASIPLNGDFPAWNSSRGEGFTHVITVNAGEDVKTKVISFSQLQGSRAIRILSANGWVSNVTLSQPSSSGSTLTTYEGCFEILSLTGSFTPSDIGWTKCGSGGMSVSLAGPDGRVYGGRLAGLLTAATPVQVVIGSFLPGRNQEQKPKLEQNTTIYSPSPLNHHSGEAIGGSYGVHNHHCYSGSHPRF